VTYTDLYEKFNEVFLQQQHFKCYFSTCK